MVFLLSLPIKCLEITSITSMSSFMCSQIGFVCKNCQTYITFVGFFSYYFFPSQNCKDDENSEARLNADLRRMALIRPVCPKNAWTRLLSKKRMDQIAYKGRSSQKFGSKPFYRSLYTSNLVHAILGGDSLFRRKMVC